MPHIVLLGDSIFDNGSYTQGGPDVTSHLRSMLGPSATVTRCAVDGSRVVDVAAQIDAIPESATHLVLAAGGNDALQHQGLLYPTEAGLDSGVALPDAAADAAGCSGDERSGAAPTGGRVLLLALHQIMDRFEAEYARLLDLITGLRLPLAVCTIYNGDLPEEVARQAKVALCVFNDAIIRGAWERGLPVIDLRSVCIESRDYEMMIEPSDVGGRKIASAVARSLR